MEHGVLKNSKDTTFVIFKRFRKLVNHWKIIDYLDFKIYTSSFKYQETNILEYIEKRFSSLICPKNDLFSTLRPCRSRAKSS